MKNAYQPIHPTSVKIDSGVSKYCEGLTKREYIATNAMVGLLSNAETTMDKEGAARFAIEQADELLKQLEN